MTKYAVISVQLQIPLASDADYPEGVSDLEKAAEEYRTFMMDPEQYMAVAIGTGPGWIKDAGYRLMETE